MKSPISIIILYTCFVAGCSSTMESIRDPYGSTIKRTAQLKETSNHYEITLTRIEGNWKSLISFRSPKKRIIETDEITVYARNTTNAGQPSWSGGAFAGGFIFVNRDSSPFYLEVHALELGDCNCRHVFPYFGNGRYQIKQEGDSVGHSSRGS